MYCILTKQILHVLMAVCVYSLANNRVQPGGVALRNLEAGQSAGFDDEVIHTKFDILSFHLLKRGEQDV